MSSYTFQVLDRHICFPIHFPSISIAWHCCCRRCDRLTTLSHTYTYRTNCLMGNLVYCLKCICHKRNSSIFALELLSREHLIWLINWFCCCSLVVIASTWTNTWTIYRLFLLHDRDQKFIVIIFCAWFLICLIYWNWLIRAALCSFFDSFNSMVKQSISIWVSDS